MAMKRAQFPTEFLEAEQVKDRTDRKAVALGRRWEKILTRGDRLHLCGLPDAHLLHELCNLAEEALVSRGAIRAIRRRSIAGGLARAAALPKRRRSEIAKMGGDATAAKRRGES